MSQHDRKRHRDGTDLDDSTRRGGSAIFQHLKEAAQKPRAAAPAAASAPMSHAERLRAEAAAFAASQRAELPEDEPVSQPPAAAAAPAAPAVPGRSRWLELACPFNALDVVERTARQPTFWALNDALTFAAPIRRAAAELVLLLGGVGNFSALHLRVEPDWLAHCAAWERLARACTHGKCD